MTTAWWMLPCSSTWWKYIYSNYSPLRLLFPHFITSIFQVPDGAVKERLQHLGVILDFDLCNFRRIMKTRNLNTPKQINQDIFGSFRCTLKGTAQGCRASPLLVLVRLIGMGRNTYSTFIPSREFPCTWDQWWLRLLALQHHHKDSSE